MTVCSIVVLTYNSQSDIQDCLKSVSDQSFEEEYEIIVADNNSTDGTVSLVKKEFPTVELVEFNQNWGTAEGYNRAFNYTKGEYVVYLNPDTVVHYEWLEMLYKTLVGTEAAAAHSCVFEPYHEEFEGLNRHANPGRRVMFEMTPWGFIDDHYTGTEPQNTLFLSATSMMIRRDIVQELDELFDANLPMYGDDLDLSLRLTLLGYRTVHAPNSIVYHRQFQKEKLTEPRWLLKKYVWLTTSRFQCFYKTTTRMEYLMLMPRLLLAGVINIRILNISNWKKIGAYIASVFLSLYSLMYALLKRKQYDQKRERLLERQRNSIYRQVSRR